MYKRQLYDKNLLEKVANKKNIDVNKLHKYDEKPHNFLISRKVRGYSNSIEENVAEMQFEYLEEMAENGESFIVVGRCSEHVLKENPNMISIFILGDIETKALRIAKIHNITVEKDVYKRQP